MTPYSPIHARDSRDFLNGYRAGYQDGLAAGLRGQTADPEHFSLPIETLGLSVRAFHCLTRNKCLRIGDVIRLSLEDIYAIRNLGAVTADEIARALHRQKIFQTAWDHFLSDPK